VAISGLGDGRLFLKTRPMGIAIVRLLYLAGLILLVADVAQDAYAGPVARVGRARLHEHEIL